MGLSLLVNCSLPLESVCHLQFVLRLRKKQKFSKLWFWRFDLIDLKPFFWELHF